MTRLVILSMPIRGKECFTLLRTGTDRRVIVRKTDEMSRAAKQFIGSSTAVRQTILEGLGKEKRLELVQHLDIGSFTSLLTLLSQPEIKGLLEQMISRNSEEDRILFEALPYTWLVMIYDLVSIAHKDPFYYAIPEVRRKPIFLGGADASIQERWRFLSIPTREHLVLSLTAEERKSVYGHLDLRMQGLLRNTLPELFKPRKE